MLIAGGSDGTQDLASATINLRQNFGLTAKTASGFAGTVLARGGEVSTVATAFTTLSKQIQAAKGGTDTAVGSFAKLGITIGELRKLPTTGGRQVPALALTAYAGAEEQGRILSAGFDGYLAKPIEATALAAAVHRLVEPRPSG